MDLVERAKGSLLGLAVGDAIGTSVEFKPRGTFTPVTDMVGGGVFHLQAGQWTDDTSMALCLADSLIECHGFDPIDQMQKYSRWMQEGYRSSIGRCFDIGGTTSNSIRKFLQTGEPYSGSTAEYDSGNGCIMRLAPVAIAYQFDEGKNLFYSGESSRVTHASIQCIESSKLFGNILRKALLGHEKRSILLESGGFEIAHPKVRSLASAEYLTRSIDDIRGSGYVIECLEAALWCFAKTDSFEGAVLKATNLGDDADTTAAVCGQICGAYYGKDNIPLNWLDTLHLREEIESLASQLSSIFQDAS